MIPVKDSDGNVIGEVLTHYWDRDGSVFLDMRITDTKFSTMIKDGSLSGKPLTGILEECIVSSRIPPPSEDVA